MSSNIGTSKSKSSDHFILSFCEAPHGLEEFSIATYAFPNSVGKSEAINARCLLMSKILSNISIFTGQISSHALHDVQAQSSSGVTLSNTLDVLTFKSIGVVTVEGTAGFPVSDIT